MIDFPYVRVMPLRNGELPRPLVVVSLEGLACRRDEQPSRGYIHSTLPMQWLLPAIVRALGDIGVRVPDEFVDRGEGFLAWAELDDPTSDPDLSSVQFADYLGMSNV